MNKNKQTVIMKKRRAQRTRALLLGTAQRPRISVHKSNTHLYIQYIDDISQKTIIGVSTAMKDLRTTQGKDRVTRLVETASQKAKEKGITTALFDRGSYRFHGTVKTIAEGLRKSGIRI
ncbi:MAG: 50S ribosomal protein L18 [Candidatus Paceibacterota bacterium]